MHEDLRTFIDNPCLLTWYIAQTCLVGDKPLYHLVGSYQGEYPNVEFVKRIVDDQVE